MNFYVLTLFPDMVRSAFSSSITGRALEKGAITLETIDIRDYSEDTKHHRVDDAPYGGGAGLLMQAGPVCAACDALKDRLSSPARVIYLTPQGKVFNQEIARELACEEELVFLCGHYEGIDERALTLCVTDYLSVGDFVLTGGEIAAVMMMDCISRLVPGVLHNAESAEEESFCGNLLEYPQYTRPETFRGLSVPAVLLSGDHGQVEAYRRRESILRTLERRPELLKGAKLTLKEQEFLDEQIRERAGRDEGICDSVQSLPALGQFKEALRDYIEELGRPSLYYRIRKRTMKAVKALMDEKEVSLEDLTGYFRVRRAQVKKYHREKQDGGE